jgi:uncharacterized protein
VTTLDTLDWLLLGGGGFTVGFAKTAFGGAGTLAAVCFAAALPARESTGALLPLLVAGDVLALVIYRRHCRWSAFRDRRPRYGERRLMSKAYRLAA